MSATRSTSSPPDVAKDSPRWRVSRRNAIFWDRFDYYTAAAQSTPWVTSVMDNHYHTLGYLRKAEGMPQMMQRLHGLVAKLVNDLLPERRDNFWRDTRGREYFDGCIRDQKQARRAYRYTLTQSERHGIYKDYRDYPHTRVNVELERAVRRALELNAFMEGVPYKRYER